MCRGQRTGQPWVQTSPSTSFETRSLFLFTAACTRLAGIFPVSGAHLPVSALELQMHMLPHLAFKWLLGDLDSCLLSQQFLYPLIGSHFPSLSPGFLHGSLSKLSNYCPFQLEYLLLFSFRNIPICTVYKLSNPYSECFRPVVLDFYVFQFWSVYTCNELSWVEVQLRS